MPLKDMAAKRKYQKEHIARRRKKWFDANGPCVDCGSWERLELDHVDPSTKVSHKIFGWKMERLLAEAAKCQIRCHNCHLAKTVKYLSEKFSKPVVHGTYAGYRTYKCRCKACRDNYTIYRRRHYLSTHN